MFLLGRKLIPFLCIGVLALWLESCHLFMNVCLVLIATIIQKAICHICLFVIYWLQHIGFGERRTPTLRLTFSLFHLSLSLLSVLSVFFFFSLLASLSFSFTSLIPSELIIASPFMAQTLKNMSKFHRHISLTSLNSPSSCFHITNELRTSTPSKFSPSLPFDPYSLTI